MYSKIVGINDGFLFQLYSGTAKRPNTTHGLLQRTIAILTYYFPQRIFHAHCNDLFLAAVSISFPSIILLFIFIFIASGYRVSSGYGERNRSKPYGEDNLNVT
jgi:hypothetical protein